jgi:hypothetical protein
MLAFRDVHGLSPICLGCHKRWACYSQKERCFKS